MSENDRLTIEEVDKYIEYVADGSADMENFFPMRVAKQLAATMRENERLKVFLKDAIGVAYANFTEEYDFDPENILDKAEDFLKALSNKEFHG